jgi:uncharacterized protein
MSIYIASSDIVEIFKDFALQIPEQLPYLKMLILFGSRAKGKANEDSDYDFAILYDREMYEASKRNGLSWFSLYSKLENIFGLPNEKADIVDLNKCSEIFAHIIARDGKLIYEKESGEYDAFIKRSLKTPEEIKEIRREEREKLGIELQRLRV